MSAPTPQTNSTPRATPAGQSSARRRRRVGMAVAALLAGLAVAACSSDSESGASSTPTTSGATSTSTTPSSESPASSDASTTTEPAPDTSTPPGATCIAPDTTPLQVTDLGNDRDVDITSFDGTVIRGHWFPVAADDASAAPTVMMGPGWGSAGDVNVEGGDILGITSIAGLRNAGFNVFTWDPRGFGESTGVVTIDSPDYEGRDVEQMIDWLATQPEVALDATGDPRLGMIGGSYGGGIQLVTAPLDCRIDAIVPIIAWNSLVTSLAKNATPKTGWSTFLSVVTASADVDPTVARAQEAGVNTGTIAADDLDWFAERGPGDSVADIAVPTLIIQGTVDTLFTLDEAIANYALLADAGTTVSMVWFCGGHGVCLTDEGDTTLPVDAAIAWLQRYVALDTAVDTGPAFQYVDQHGTWFSADAFTTGTGEPLTGTGTGTLDLLAEGGAGPAVVEDPSSALGSIIGQITPARAANAVDVEITNTTDAVAHVVGGGELTITYSGTPGDGDRPTRVFAQLVDPATGLVLGNQITPIEIVLDGNEHTTTVAIEAVAHTLDAGDRLTLQLVATTVAYATPQFGGTITFSAIEVALPTSTDVTAN